MSDEQPALRVALVGIVVVSLFAALLARLYYLQVLRTTTVEEVFGGPLLREVTYQGTRGRILDRNGNVLVDSRESIVVTIDRQEYEAIEDKDGLELRLARALNTNGFPTKVSDIVDRIADPRYDPLKPVPVAEDVNVGLETYLLERLDEFPSVDVVRAQVRTYPNGTLAAHVLGYTGSINSEELDAREHDAKAYQPGDDIGKAGVERIFESELRATPGVRTIEVDPTEREIGTRGNEPSVPGADLQLTIDLDLQRASETLLQDALVKARQQTKRRSTDPDLNAPAGAVVVLDAQSSAVLAMASFPTYDPAEFSGGISAFRFNELNDPAAYAPFTNRAIQAGYSPGSTFKPFTAVAAMARGALSADDVVNDTGSYRLDKCTDTCVFSNAGGTAYGRVDLREALTVSSDVYFYRLGELLWDQRATVGDDAMQQTARQFGMGSVTGIQLPDEYAGLISDPAFKAARHTENPEAFPYGEWFTGDNVNLAIGQGDLEVTPLQLANAYAALADGGVLHAPSVAKALLEHDTGKVVREYAPRELAAMPLPAEIKGPIIDGLAGVVSDEDGTAHDAFRGFPLGAFSVAGKTGTAEKPPKADTALFAGFGPVDDPRYVVVAVIEEAGFASDTAAPLVRRIMEQLPEVKPHVVAPPPTSSTVPGSTATTGTTSRRDIDDAGGAGDSGSATTESTEATPATTTGTAPPTTTTAPPETTTSGPAPTTSTAPTAPSTAPTEPTTTVASTSAGGADGEQAPASVGGAAVGTDSPAGEAQPQRSAAALLPLPLVVLAGRIVSRRRTLRPNGRR